MSKKSFTVEELENIVNQSAQFFDHQRLDRFLEATFEEFKSRNPGAEIS